MNLTMNPTVTQPMEASPSQDTKVGPNKYIPYTPPASGISLAVDRFGVGPEMRFRVEYDLGQGAQPIRMTVSKDESYEKFLRRLRNIFYGDSFERSLRRWVRNIGVDLSSNKLGSHTICLRTSWGFPPLFCTNPWTSKQTTQANVSSYSPA